MSDVRPTTLPHGPVQLRDVPSGAGPIVAEILQELPTWFGIAASVANYVAVADRSATTVASLAGKDVGVLTLVSHSRYAAEVFVMAVLPEHHRQGIGRAMLERAEATLGRAGVEFLQVKTLAASRPDEGYARTRAFYLDYGFRPLEEFPDLWDADNPALQMVKVVPAP
ncbi:MAG: GNAT family N-acetyltransferase [Acidimicrobiales bacterium]